jgi:ADP-heptose:LPS heptosyltransferase
MTRGREEERAINGVIASAKRPPTNSVRRILVTAYGHTADTLPAGPCLAALRSSYPDARIELLVVKEVADLWRACPYIDAVRVMRDFKRKGTRLGRLEQVWRLAQLTLRLRGRFDMVIVLHARSKFFGYLAYLSGAACRVGYRDDSAAQCFTHEAVPYEGIVSFREENRRIMQALGITVDNRHLEMWPTPEARAEADQLLGAVSASGPLIGVHPGSHWACQRWPNQRWAAVADALTEAYGAQIVITGSSEERELAEDIASQMHSTPLIATGKTSIPGFGEIVRQCHVLFCVNSAASQVALAMKTPVVNLVGLEPLTWTEPEAGEDMSIVRQCTESSTAWCPLGVWGRLSQCQRSDHVGLAGLEAIEPVHVLSAAKRWLGPGVTSAEYRLVSRS